jgi:hypothetical protein
MARNKYNANFYEGNKKYNTNQNNEGGNLDNNHDRPHSTELENNNDYPQTEFAEDFEKQGSCSAEFERARRQRNKPENLK